MSETVAEKFWRESRELKEYRNGLEGLHGVARYEAVLKHVWTAESLGLDKLPPIRWGQPQELDEWLAEDNPHRMPGVLEALGL
jgi:hypothetical protein